MPKVVVQVIALGLEDVVVLVFGLPATATGPNDINDLPAIPNSNSQT